MCAYDIGAVALTVVFAALGAMRGFAWEAGLFCAVTLGVAAAIRLGRVFAEAILSGLPSQTALPLGFALVFLMVFIAILVVTHFTRRAIERMKLRKADAVAGGVFGFVQGLTVCFLATLALMKFGTPQLKGYVSDSYSASVATAGASLLRRVSPEAARHLPLNVRRTKSNGPADGDESREAPQPRRAP